MSRAAGRFEVSEAIPTVTARWLLQPPVDAPSRLAGALHSRHSLTIPVDIDALSFEYADVHNEAWPFDCDAITVGLVSERPTIFLKDGVPRLRRRFTLAHELGHVVIGWHIGDVACSPYRGGSPQAEGPNLEGQRVLSLAGFRGNEREANSFASQILLPWSYLNDLASNEDMNYLLDGVDAAEISAHAGLLGLSRALQPGFVFSFQKVTGEPLTYITSPGTSLPFRNSQVNRRLLQREAKDSGETSLGRRSVAWYRLTEHDHMPSDDGISSRELLSEAIQSTNLSPSAADALAKKIQAVASGLLSKLRGDEVQTLGTLRHRFTSFEHDGSEAIDKELLDRFLVAKVRERFKRLA